MSIYTWSLCRGLCFQVHNSNSRVEFVERVEPASGYCSLCKCESERRCRSMPCTVVDRAEKHKPQRQRGRAMSERARVQTEKRRWERKTASQWDGEGLGHSAPESEGRTQGGRGSHCFWVAAGGPLLFLWPSRSALTSPGMTASRWKEG